MGVPELFEVTEVLQESERFLVQKGTYLGRMVVCKQAKIPEMFLNLASELQAYEIYGALIGQSKAPFTVASVIDSSFDWVMLEHLDGRPMSDLVDDSNQTVMYDQLAAIMAFCDNRAAITIDGSPLPTSDTAVRRKANRMQEIRAQLERLDEHAVGYLRHDLERAADFYIAHCSQLKTAFVNADLTPAHVMVNGDNFAIFDFENARIDGERFSDVINWAAKLWFTTGDEKLAMDFYDSFWLKKDELPGDYSLQLKALIYRRCIGFANELITEPDQYHNTSLTMNENFAKNIKAVIGWAESL